MKLYLKFEINELKVEGAKDIAWKKTILSK